MNTEEQHPSRFALERVLDGSAEPEMRAHVDACERCQKRVAVARDDAQDYLRKYPSLAALEARSKPAAPASAAPASAAPASAAPARFSRRWVGLAAAASIAALVGSATWLAAFESGPKVRTKGG